MKTKTLALSPKKKENNYYFGLRRTKTPLNKKLFLLGVFLCVYSVYLQCGYPGLPCPLYEIFHIQCPTCGISRMFLSLFDFNLQAAFDYNAYILVSLPFILIEIIYFLYYFKDGYKKIPLYQNILLTIYFIGLIFFGILRNIPF